MKKYIVKAVEKNYGYAVIEAESKEEAEEKALDAYNDGHYIWEGTTLSEFSAEEEGI